MMRILQNATLAVLPAGSGLAMAAALTIEDLLDRKVAARKTWRP